MPDRRIEAVITQSIDYATGEQRTEDIVGLPIMPWLAKAHSQVPPWWSTSRDAFLREFWKRSSHLSMMMYTAQTLLANTPIRVEPKNPSISSHVEQAEMYTEHLLRASEFGETLLAAKGRMVEDYLAQDNGGFLEVLGDGRPDGPIVGMPLAVRHLDAAYCWRTGHPDYPVVYHDPVSGFEYKLHATRVIALSQMSSTQANMHGVGFSAVSRSIQFAQHLYDIYIYKQEKLGSRPISKIVVGSGFRGSHIMQAVRAANEAMSNANLSRYSKVVGLGSDDTDAKLNALDLNDFDPFDEEVSTLFAMYGMAAAFGIPIQEVWPTNSGRGGRVGDQQESRQRGKLPAEFNAALVLQLGRKFLPPHLRAVADWRDDFQDERRAVVQDIRARNRERDLGNSAVTIRSARQDMLYAGDITREQFLELEMGDGRLEDGRPIDVLFYSDDQVISRVLKMSVDNPTSVLVHDPLEMLDELSEKRTEILKELATSNSDRLRRKYGLALAAVDSLMSEYQIIANRPPPLAGSPAASQMDETVEAADVQAEQIADLEAGKKPAERAGEGSPRTRDPDQVRPATVEQKQVNDSQFLEFLITMESEILDEFDKENPDRRKLEKMITGWLLFAFLEGANKSEDDLTAEEAKIIRESQKAFLDQMDRIMERKASGNDMRATAIKLTNQAAYLFWTAFVKNGEQGEELTWVLGSTKEHCADCLGNDGETKTRAEWAKGGMLPQSPGLECTGIHCLCYFVPASE